MQTEFFALLQPALRQRIESASRVVRLRKGQTVIEHRSRSNDVFILAEGEVRVLIYSPDGREVSVRTLKANALFGELAAIDGQPRSASVIAMVPSVVVAMRRADFCNCIENSPAAALWLARNFAAQIRVLTDRIFELSALNVRSRLYCELLRLASSTETKGNQLTLKSLPTHAELANRIGTHREAVTRELRALHRRGIVVQRRRQLVIEDITALSGLVSHLETDAIRPISAEMFA